MFISLSEAQLQMNAMLPLGGKSLRLKLVLLFLFILLSCAELPFEVSVVIILNTKQLQIQIYWSRGSGNFSEDLLQVLKQFN